MPIETELKLRISPDQLSKLRRHALLKSLATTRPVTRRLYNIYYDTPKLELHKIGMALRLRRIGRQWLQTLKGGGSVRAGLHQRNEWEAPVKSAALDFSIPEMSEWDEHLPKALRKKLQPVFVTDFSRTSRMLSFLGAEIELCMDKGLVSTELHGLPICEVELELKSGQPQQLFELALTILGIVPFELEVVSKAEQGYRLLSGHGAKPVKGVVPDIARTAMLSDVLQTLIWSCLLHLQNNLRGALGSADTEYLHQMRVALRRLRVVLSMVEKFCADEQLAALNKEFATLCIALGRLREWDVLIAQTMRPICKRMPGHAGLKTLLATCERLREECHEALRNEQQARELQRLILRFSIWINSAYWQQPEAFLAHDFAGSRLSKLLKRFVLSARQLDTVDAGRLHALRILAKKLRYSAEFFASLYDKQKSKPFIAALSEIQDVLGQINDVAVAHRLLEELAVDMALFPHQEAVALAKGWIAHDLSDQLDALRKNIQYFNKQSAFWVR